MTQPDTCENTAHQLRGYMVKKRTEEEIAGIAIEQFLFLKRHNLSLSKIEAIVDILDVKQEIRIHIERNADWDRQHSPYKKGESKPSEKSITIPKRVYDGVRKGKAQDLEVLFHEIGHVALEHTPIYMKADGYVVTVMDDAEEQADLFAAVLLRLFEIALPVTQLELDLQ